MSGTWTVPRLSPKSWATFCWTCKRGAHHAIRREARNWIRQHRADVPSHERVVLYRVQYRPERDRQAERAARAAQRQLRMAQAEAAFRTVSEHALGPAPDGARSGYLAMNDEARLEAMGRAGLSAPGRI